MPPPTDALRKAEGIRPATSPASDTLEKGLTAFLHFVGLPTGLPLDPGPNPQMRPASQAGSAGALGDVLAAAVPFPMGMQVFRGATPAKMLAHNPEGFINFAEDAAHAAAFAKHPGGSVMPASLDVQRALDLTPDALGSLHGAESAAAAGDLKQLEGFIPPDLQSQFKRNKTYWRGNDADARYEGRQGILGLVEQLQRQNPTFLKDAGFDGMRYVDGATPAWAVLDPAQIKPAIGKR